MDNTEQRLQRIEDKIDTLIADHDKVQQHHHVLYGNGHAGLMMDVDRLKTESKQWHWALATAVVALSMPVGEYLWHFWIR